MLMTFAIAVSSTGEIDAFQMQETVSTETCSGKHFFKTIAVIPSVLKEYVT